MVVQHALTMEVMVINPDSYSTVRKTICRLGARRIDSSESYRHRCHYFGILGSQ